VVAGGGKKYFLLHEGNNNFDVLGVLARRVLAIPATSAAPERLFSTAGDVMTKKRSCVTCLE